MEVLFIRHGESTYNEKKLMQGNANPPLTKKGIQQAEILSERFDDINDYQIFSSPLSRAYGTAEVFSNKFKKEVNIIDELSELDLGDFSGLSWNNAKLQFPELFQSSQIEFWQLFANNKIPNQEKYSALLERANSVIDLLSKQVSKAIIFGHKGFLEAFIAKQLNFKLERSPIKIDSTSITSFQFINGSAIFNFINDTNHVSAQLKGQFSSNIY